MNTRASAAGIAAALCAAALAACGTLPSAPSLRTGAAPAAPAPAEPSVLRLGQLSPRSLASGECGLFLWTRTDSPELVFFSNPETGRAAIVLNGDELSMRRLSVEGAGAGRPGAQTFATDKGDVSLRLTIQQTEPVDRGYRVSAASLRVTNVEGWSGVVAAAGLAACQT